MALSWNEIKGRALDFSREWAGEAREDAEAKSFWDAFFHVFGLERRRVAAFEEPVRRLDQNYGFIDLFWKGTLLVEHKSRGKDLDKAYSQALGYFAGLKDHELPKYILVSDFDRFRLYDLDSGAQDEFPLAALHDHVHLFGFMAGYTRKTYAPEDPVNIKAAELMARLHDRLLESGYEGHPLEIYLVRLLFCLFADDTGIFEKGIFAELISPCGGNGSNLGMILARLFEVLDTPVEQRNRTINEVYDAFPYINGKLFHERLPFADFTSSMRDALLDACHFEWSSISPAIFGSLFQSVMEPTERREIGAHYTAEQNILKLIRPLFLDALQGELRQILELKRGKKQRLEEFHDKLANLKFLDPACGCGNFLIVTYRELRLLEIEAIKALHHDNVLDIGLFCRVNVDQMAGIEIEEFPARIAEVAMWLVDHQMNVRLSEAFGMYYVRLPLRKAANIVHHNALDLDWGTLLPKGSNSFILGNPPFVGGKYQTPGQKADVAAVFKGVNSAGVLDYVACWYVRAAQFIQGTDISVAFVSTNSICQGEQPGILWEEMFLRQGVKIHFAHQTFAWESEARGKAHVHVVIIGFAAIDTPNKRLFEYDNIKGEPHEAKASNINPYLVDAPDIFLHNRSNPLCQVPKLGIGNKPIDGGFYLFTSEEKAAFLQEEPGAAKFFHSWQGADEFLYNQARWVLWLGDAAPQELRQLPMVMKRIEQVKNFRLASKSEPTRKLALTPTRFHVENMPKTKYLLIPKVSSEKRRYIPLGFVNQEVLSSDLVHILPGAGSYHFGVLSSTMHMAWVKRVCGRLESRFRYSNKLVYNNFPWPEPTVKQKAEVEEKAEGVLAARSSFPGSTLADLYDPLTMPPALLKAHVELDKAVDRCYRPAAFMADAERLEHLFALHGKLISPSL